MRTRIFTLCFLFLALPAFAGADICDDIDTLANAWNEIADLLEVDVDEEIGDLDVRRLERDVNRLLPLTEDLGDFLIDLGNRRERDMGEGLLDLVDELYDVSSDDLSGFLVDRIDDLVDCMDYITDYCDAVHE